MSKRWHVNNDGETKRCYADKKPCRFAASSHGDTPEEARKNYEASMSQLEIPETSGKKKYGGDTDGALFSLDSFGEEPATPVAAPTTPAKSIEQAKTAEEITQILRENRQPRLAQELYEKVVANPNADGNAVMTSMFNAIATRSINESAYERADFVRAAYNHPNLSEQDKAQFERNYPTLKTGQTAAEIVAAAPGKVDAMYAEDRERFDEIFQFTPITSRNRSYTFSIPRMAEIRKQQLDVPGALVKAFKLQNKNFNPEQYIVTNVSNKIVVSSRSI